MGLAYSFITDKGDRNENEDSVGVFENGANRCFVVCDGLGGHGMGDIASKTVVNEFERQFLAAFEMSEFLPIAFDSAQNVLLETQAEYKAKSKMKTTCVALATDDKNAYIGHVGDSRLYVFQKNKVKYLVGKVSLIHSVDSFSLLQEIEKQAARRDLVQDVLLEINIAGEDSKSGMEASRLPEILEMAAPLEHVRILGLMAIPPICSDPEENRPYFAKMRQLFVDNAGKKYDNSLMKCLSMGMSSDFETAITEGATMVRVGTAIFGRRDYGI